jgi:hypothetical protein
MALGLKNFRTQLPDNLIKKAEKLKVRDLDFYPNLGQMAFVEEGKEDFDVSLQIDASGIILQSNCDCGDQTAFCVHKAALLIFLEEKSPKKETSKKEKKLNINNLSPLELRLMEVQEMELKTWLIQQFKKNKVLEFEFRQAFLERKLDFSPESVKALSREVEDSVVKNKKKRKLELSELQKIISLWKPAHKPVVAFYLEKPEDENHYKALVALMTSILAFYYRISNSTNKTHKYSETIYAQAADRICAIVTYPIWLQAVTYFMKFIDSNPSNQLRWEYLEFLLMLSEKEEGERKDYLLKYLSKLRRI